MAWIVLGVVSAIGLLGYLRRTLVVVTVDGPSMEPSYPDGATVLARRLNGRRVRVNQVLMIVPPQDGPSTGRPGRLWLVKRVAAVPGDPVPGGLGPALAHLANTPVPPGHLVVLGDNPGHSYDSRQEGFIAADRVRAAPLRPR